MRLLPEQRVTACRALSTGSKLLRVLPAGVVGYFYFGYWFSRMSA